MRGSNVTEKRTRVNTDSWAFVRGLYWRQKRVGIFRIVGPSLGGLFLLWIDVGGCLAFYRVALLVFGVELLPVRVPNTAPRPVGSNWLEDIKEGLTYIQAHFDVVEHTCGVCPEYFRRNYQRFLPVFA